MNKDERAWAEVELGHAALGDPRRTRRLVLLATRLAEQPTAGLPEAGRTDAERKGAYRFVANRCIAPQPILASHVQATQQRCRAAPVVLAAQDTTLLDYTLHPQTTGLGKLASAKQQGLVVHSTLALTPDGLPLGLLAQEVWTRDPATYGALADHKQRPIADKESQKWLTSLAAVRVANAAAPATQFVSVGDREADVYELFTAPRPAGVALLVRASWDRCVDAAEGHLWAALAAAAVLGSVAVRIPRHGTQPARTATLALRARAVTLQPPARAVGPRLEPVRLWAVQATEVDAPAGVAPVDWRLLTTVPTTSTEQAAERLRWYACRWGIEVWHKTLKSGCRIESKQLETAANLRRCLPLASVVAWRVHYTTMLARELPDAPCTLILAEDEWQALCCAIGQTPIPPAEPPSLRHAVRWIAKLGGFLGRAGDGEPGTTTIWRGLHHLTDLTTMYRIMQPISSLTAPPQISVGNA